MGSQPLVTVAIPCFNEERFIEGCIRSVLSQDYPGDLLEIVVADGMSTDATRGILARLSKENPCIQVIDNPSRIQATSMNAILRVARGSIIVRMDVHCDYQNDYIRKCVEVLEKTGADTVGGAQRVKAITTFQRALAAALSSHLGRGGARYRSAEDEGFVETVYLGAFRRSVFEKVGLYDPGAITNEDAELNQRLLAAGGKIYLSREIVAHYYPRTTFQALATQYFKYGMGRARTLLKHKSLPSIRSVLPFFMVVAGGALLALSLLYPPSLAGLAFYALVTAGEAWRIGRPVGRSAVPVVWAIFGVLHVAHGSGFAAGLVRYVLNPDWKQPERLPRAPLREPLPDKPAAPMASQRIGPAFR